MSADIQRIAVGDEVLLFRTPRPGEKRSLDAEPFARGKVTKTGRKWATVEAKTRFGSDAYYVHRWTGAGRPGRSGYAAGYYGLTEAMLHDERLKVHYRTEARARSWNTYWWRDLTVEETLAVLKILEPTSARSRL